MNKNIVQDGKNRSVSIYVWADSRTSENIRYVGKTVCKKVSDRISGELSEARSGHKCHRCNCIRKIIDSGSSLFYKVIDVCDESNWREFEKHYIAKYWIEGYDLVNQCIGGQGSSGWTASEEIKQKMSFMRKGRPAHPNTIAGAIRANSGHSPARSTIEAAMRANTRKLFFCELVNRGIITKNGKAKRGLAIKIACEKRNSLQQVAA